MSDSELGRLVGVVGCCVAMVIILAAYVYASIN
jgi:hypothetical protein